MPIVKKVIAQFQELVKNIPNSKPKIKETEVDPNDFPLVDTALPYKDIEGLSTNENRVERYP